MAFVLSANTGKVTKTTGFNSTSTKTVIVHVKCVANSGSGMDGTYLNTQGVAASEIFHSDSSSAWAGNNAAGSGRDSTLASVAGEWHVLISRDTGGVNTLHVYKQSNDTFYQQRSGTQTAGALVEITCGASAGSSRTTCPVGTKFAYLRYWETYLTDSEIRTEVTNATAQKAGVIIDEPFTSGAGVMTASGGSFDSDVPGYVGSGTNVARLAAYYRMLRAS